MKEKVTISTDRQLFFDDYLIESMTNVTRKMNPATPREVVLPMEKPWEGETSACGVVLQDGELYKMWYRVAPYTDTKNGTPSGEWWNYTAYAESTDGVHWERPELGLFDYEGSKKNNIVWKGPGGNMSVFKEERQNIPGETTTPSEERFKAITRTNKGVHGLVSPDGIWWKLIQDDLVLTGGMFDSHNIVFQDPWTFQYRYYGRGFVKPRDNQSSDLKHGIRRIRYSVSINFKEWGPLEFIDMGEEPLDHLYTNASAPYTRARGIYMMFPKRYVPERTFDPDWPQVGQSDIVFSATRDGVTWDRSFLEAFVRPGPNQRNWHERALAMGQGMLQTSPEEISLYYYEHVRTESCRIRRCTVRTDGFVSVNALFKGGEFTTRPIVFSGKSLFMNYATSAVGSVRVELQDLSGDPIRGFSLAECPEIFGDQLDRAVAWNGEGDVSRFAGEPVRLRFVIKDADLFSFRFL